MVGVSGGLWQKGVRCGDGEFVVGEWGSNECDVFEIIVNGVVLVCCDGVTWHDMSCRVLSCRVFSCRVVSCRVVSCRVVSCRVVSCRVVWCRVVSCRVVSSRVV